MRRDQAGVVDHGNGGGLRTPGIDSLEHGGVERARQSAGDGTPMMLNPPSTWMTSPVTADDRSEPR